MDAQCIYESPLGPMLLRARGDALTGAWFLGQKYFPADVPPCAEFPEAPALLQAKVFLDSYFSGQRPDPFALVLDPQGSPFRQTVWQQLRAIPYGTTVTYGELSRAVAAQLGKPSMSAQAIGGAVGHNPISVILPCHRVVGADGSLTGYAGGLERKQWLLALEQR